MIIMSFHIPYITSEIPEYTFNNVSPYHYILDASMVSRMLHFTQKKKSAVILSLLVEIDCQNDLKLDSQYKILLISIISTVFLQNSDLGEHLNMMIDTLVSKM